MIPMGNLSCFKSGSGLSIAEQGLARYRYFRVKAKGAEEISRDKFLHLFGQGDRCADRLFTIVDKDANGSISFKEICDCIVTSRSITKTQEAKLQVLFEFYDKDTDGKLSRLETSNAMLYSNVSIPKPQVDQLVQTVFGLYDEDKDNHLNFKEFSNMMKAACSGPDELR